MQQPIDWVDEAVQALHAAADRVDRLGSADVFSTWAAMADQIRLVAYGLDPLDPAITTWRVRALSSDGLDQENPNGNPVDGPPRRPTEPAGLCKRANGSNFRKCRRQHASRASKGAVGRTRSSARESGRCLAALPGEAFTGPRRHVTPSAAVYRVTLHAAGLVAASATAP